MTQIRCGKLKAYPATNRILFDGRIALQGRLDDVLQLAKHPRADADNDRAPAYEVFIQPPGQARGIPCGAAWLKNHVNVGDFLSITVDKVDWPRPLNLTAFPPDERKGDAKGEWTVVWSRPRGQRVQDEAVEGLDRETADHDSR